MNGRVYDYNLGRFMSVDPFIHGGSQGMNPYSYLMNNPMAGTDPSGYSPECNNTGSHIKGGGGSSTCLVTVNNEKKKQAPPDNVPEDNALPKGQKGNSSASLLETNSELEKATNDENTSENNSKGVLNGVTAYIGQQIGDAGAARDEYNKKLSSLAPDDSDGRSKIKQETRNKTPKLINDLIVKNRPSTGAKPGSGGTANRSNPKANKAASILKHSGRGLIVVNLSMNAVDVATSENTELALMRSAFGAIGGIGGGIAGAIGGSFIAPGPGTAVGGVSGAALGGAGGEWLGETVYDFFWGRREDSSSN